MFATYITVGLSIASFVIALIAFFVAITLRDEVEMLVSKFHVICDELTERRRWTR